MMSWFLTPGCTSDHIGFIPTFLNDSDPRPAKEQINYNYIGGWCPMPEFKLLPNGSLEYPGDPILPMLAMTRLRDEIIRVYEFAWVSIEQPDGTFEVSRVD